jgi:hypothetical protein
MSIKELAKIAQKQAFMVACHQWGQGTLPHQLTSILFHFM